MAKQRSNNLRFRRGKRWTKEQRLTIRHSRRHHRWMDQILRQQKVHSRASKTHKKFHLGDVLSITTGRLVSNRHMDGVYDILDFMTGDNLFTHQPSRASDECKPWLLKWFPELAEAGTPKNLSRLTELVFCAEQRKEPRENGIIMWLKWMAEPGMCNLKQEYEVQQIPKKDHQHKNPTKEATEMMGDPKKVIVVVTG